MTNPTEAKKPKVYPNRADLQAIEMAKYMAANFLPWWSPVIRQLVIKHDENATSMGVTASGRVVYNLEFVREILKTEGLGGLAFVILHEGMHLISNTHKRGEAVGATEDARKYQLFNIAADMSINSIIKRETEKANVKYKLRMPESGVLPEKMGLPPNLSAEEYYLRLLGMKPVPKDGDGSPCNGCGVKGDGSTGISSAKIRSIKQEMANIAKGELQRGDGGLGDALVVEAEVPPKVDWRKQLQHVALRLTNMIAGSDDSTYSKRNVKSWDEPGEPVLPGSCAYQLSVVVIGDTSGSMHSHLGKIISEVNEIIAILGKVTFIACDAQVHATAAVNNKQDIANNLKGGGGTSMNPAFEAAREYKPSLIVCITDGAIGPTPGIGVKTIWCLTEPYTNDVQPSVEEGWGTIVECID